MSKKTLFGILDAAAGCYRSIFPALSVGEATRGFADLANNPDTDVGRHPQDFSLYRLGEWDDSDGSVVGLQRPEIVIQAAALRLAPVVQQYETPISQ